MKIILVSLFLTKGMQNQTINLFSNRFSWGNKQRKKTGVSRLGKDS